MDKRFIKELNARNRALTPIKLSYIENIVYDINRERIPFMMDILTFADSLNMSDSAKIIKYYIQILKNGFECQETIRLKFFMQDLIKAQRSKGRENYEY